MTRSGATCLQSNPADDAVADRSEWSTESVPGRAAEKVITQLYKDNETFILSYVTALLRDRHLAEDVVQETMLRAWRHCAGFSPEKGSVRGWLMQVAHNIAVDKIRMRQSRPAEVAQYDTSLALVEDHADRVVTAVQVRAALDRLSPAHRAVVEQVYLNGCTAREAAERLGIPEGTVFSRAFYALRQLRRDLGPAETGLPAARAALSAA
jgi:RNA polymerase sigma-70 factor (ECF subfamily)